MLVDFEVGGRRTGLAAVEDAVALARHIGETEGAIYAGVQGYNGSFQREPDFGVTSVNYDFPELLAKGQPPS